MWILFTGENLRALRFKELIHVFEMPPSPAYVKLDQLDSWMKDKLLKAPLLTMNIVYEVMKVRDMPSHITQDLMTEKWFEWILNSLRPSDAYASVN